ncbi:polysaccharide biosynthesis protein [Legionella longbeachae]|uniref:polysaccharide biosynthesis protein n=1 Tax=Legionella longbeachae TaxID=450 RepID=UPI00124873F8|nr:polysaccharide biosynthesis protein [Legionella longbeachae]QEY50106.1 NAD-dependent epimerase/dehydratase family protein [Legionella longbeachae]QEY50236.1 NAD-dependent epimerase/dehydratase family protein [Legionella longbeachae]
MFKDKVLMITGGTGSFGHAVLQRFLKSDIREIRIFSRDEKKQEDMRNELNNDKVKFYIGDVRDYSSVADAMIGVDYVFHAAALKQVPSCEFYPMEAVRTNILGTDNVLAAGIARSVKRIVVLSTDKAVYPINAMGISKAMAEKIVVAKSRVVPENGPIICATRYGNVMASRGSVIPLFVAQIKANQELTITDPQMTRFLMSLEDSVDLVLHAFTYANQGDIFIQKSPASTIADLTQALIEIFKSTSKVKIIGTRHGEKLYESLISREEMAKAEDMGRYYRIQADNRDLNYKKYFVEGERIISNYEDYTSHNTQQLTIHEIKDLLLKLDFIQNALDNNDTKLY